MTLKHNQNMTKQVIGAIAATAFLSISAILPQAAFSQSSPGTSGDPRVDEPNTNNRVDDPSRPTTENMNRGNVNVPANSMPSRGNVYSNPNSQMDNSGFGGGTGGMDLDQSAPMQPANRIERYSQPGATDPSRSTEYLPPANSPRSSNSNGQMNDQVNNSGFGGGTGGASSESLSPANSPSNSNSNGQMNDQMNNSGSGSGTGGMTNMDRGNDRYTAPNSNMPGRGTYTGPSGQINRTSGPNSGTVDSQMNNTGGGTGGTSGSIDNQINNSTSPGSATPGSGSTNYNNRSNTDGSSTNDNTNGDNAGGGTGGTGTVPGLW